MAYNKKTWESDEVITQEALNNMEDGIAAAHTAIAATNTNLAGKQDALTPGSGITITDNTIAINAATMAAIGEKNTLTVTPSSWPSTPNKAATYLAAAGTYEGIGASGADIVVAAGKQASLNWDATNNCWVKGTEIAAGGEGGGGTTPEQTLTPTATNAIPSSKAVADYVNGKIETVVATEAVVDDSNSDISSPSDSHVPSTMKMVGYVGERINDAKHPKTYSHFDVDRIRAKCPYFMQDDYSGDTGLTDYGQTNYFLNKLKKIGAAKEGEKRILWMSDAHYQNINTANPGEKSNSKTWMALMAAVKDACNIPWCVFSGDAFEAAATADNVNDRGGYVGARCLGEFMADWYSVAGGQCTVVCGNHDANNAGMSNYNNGTNTTKSAVIKSSIIEEIMMGMIADKHYDEEGLSLFEDESFGYSPEKLEEVKAYLRLNYYTDDDASKIRHIVFNTGNKSIEEVGFGITSHQSVLFSLFLLAEALKTLPEGYDVILEMHEYPGSSATSTDVVPVFNMIEAWRNRNSAFGIAKASLVSGDMSKWYYLHDVDVWNNNPDNYRSVVRVSFANANVGKILVLIGHTHYDGAYRYYRNGDSWARASANSETEFSDGDLLALNIQKSCYGRTELRAWLKAPSRRPRSMSSNGFQAPRSSA